MTAPMAAAGAAHPPAALAAAHLAAGAAAVAAGVRVHDSTVDETFMVAQLPTDGWAIINRLPLRNYAEMVRARL